MSIIRLPCEVLDQILQYLSVTERAILSRTCRALNDAVGSAPTAVTIYDAGRILNSLKVNGCEIQKFIFVSADLQQEPMRQDSWDEFWTWMGVHVTSLEFRRCQISERTFVGVINRCPHLTELVLDECNTLLMSGTLLSTRSMDIPLAFRCITHLEIVNTRYLSDSLFNRFVAYSKFLVKLSLAGCLISFHSAIFKRFYPANGPKDQASESVLTFQNVLKCVEKHARTLKCLDFSNTLIDDQALRALSQVPALCLEEIVLTSCYQMSNNGMEVLFNMQPQLRVINMKQSTKLSDQALFSLSNSAIHVQNLNLSECNKMTDEGLGLIRSLQNIVELDISGCGLLTCSGLQSALCGPITNNLTSLNISSTSLTESAIVALSRNLASLRHLNMSNCCDGMTDVALQAVILNVRWLRSLQLAWCKKITDYGLTGCHYKLPNISPCSTPSPASPISTIESFIWLSAEMSKVNMAAADHLISDTSPTGSSLSRLSGLMKLDLCGCSEITDISLQVAIRFRELSYLNLSLCERITDSGLVSVGASNGSLETLKLSQCRNITDLGVVAITTSLPRLKHLDVQGCQKIGNQSMEAVGKWCPSLRFLDVSICPGIAAHTLVELEKKLENLRLNQRQLRSSEIGGTLFQTSSFSKIKGFKI